MVLSLLLVAAYIHVCAFYRGRLHWGLWDLDEFSGYFIQGRDVHEYSGGFTRGFMGTARPIPGFLDCTNATKVVVPTLVAERHAQVPWSGTACACGFFYESTGAWFGSETVPLLVDHSASASLDRLAEDGNGTSPIRSARHRYDTAE